jgi:hypothetical protein
MRNIFYVFLVLVMTSPAWAGSADQQVENILDQYFLIQSSLSKDTTQGVDAAARNIVKLATTSEVEDPQIAKLFVQIKTAANRIQGKDLKQTRDEFFELSKPLLVYLNQFYSGKKVFYRYFCTMAKKGWIQAHKETRNPYYGSSMLTCGDLIS